LPTVPSTRAPATAAAAAAAAATAATVTVINVASSATIAVIIPMHAMARGSMPRPLPLPVRMRRRWTMPRRTVPRCRATWRAVATVVGRKVTRVPKVSMMAKVRMVGVVCRG